MLLKPTNVLKCNLLPSLHTHIGCDVTSVFILSVRQLLKGKHTGHNLNPKFVLLRPREDIIYGLPLLFTPLPIFPQLHFFMRGRHRMVRRFLRRLRVIPIRDLFPPPLVGLITLRLSCAPRPTQLTLSIPLSKASN